MTALPIQLSQQWAHDDPPAVHDFTMSPHSAYGPAALIEIAPGIYGVPGGDGNADCASTAFDYLRHWLPRNGTPPSYHAADFDLDGNFTSSDFLKIWLPSNGRSTQVPEARCRP